MSKNYNVEVFAKNLRRAIREKGHTQRSLAEKTGISAETINKWATGKNLPSLQWLADAANALDVSIDDLLTDHKQKEVIAGAEVRPLTEEELIICRLYLEDLDKYKTCNEYRLLQGLLDGRLVVSVQDSQKGTT